MIHPSSANMIKSFGLNIVESAHIPEGKAVIVHDMLYVHRLLPIYFRIMDFDVAIETYKKVVIARLYARIEFVFNEKFKEILS